MKNLLLVFIILFAVLLFIGNIFSAECTYEEGCNSTSQWCWEGSCRDCTEGFSNCDLVKGCETEGECEECKPSWSCSTYTCDEYSVYRCANNDCGRKGGAMEEGTMWYECTECDDGCGGSSFERNGPYGPDNIRPYGQVPDYQICPPEYNEWSETPPVLECSGSCYPAPKPKPLNDDSLLPKNVADAKGKYKLPINFGWEDNIEKEVAKAPNFCPVGSYEFNIPNPSLTEIVPNTQYDQLVTTSDTSYKLECELKSNNDYQWKVRACLDDNAADCGEWSDEQSFSTSLAPEPIFPYDPDWTGEKSAKNIAIPVTLDWCDVEGATAYKFRTYIIENGNGEEICHPWMELAGACEPLVLKKTLRPLPHPSGLFLYSDFPDEEKGYFTKDTEYLWELATCIEDECSDFGQKWKFKTTGTLATTTLSWPPDDPRGQNPVGLPLILDWSDKPGVNSYWYEVTGDKKIEGGTQLSQLSLNYPELSLNTPYHWKVWACWDYQAKKCEANPIGERGFKTTGAPPNLDYPSPDARDVPIPVNFDWQDVGGAKSYVLKISGDGLAEEIIVEDKSEFVMGFPDFNIRQEKTYTWQIKTCAWEGGKACGDYSGPRTFTTFRLPAPTEPSPIDGGQLSTDIKFLSWGSVERAKAYQYQIKLLSLSEKEIDETCPPLIGKNLFEKPKIVLGSSDFVELKCLGQYQWQVAACLDKDCQEVGEWSNWTFSLVEPSEIKKGGLVPCGQTYDNPQTPWNEREPCQIKHFFLLIKIILDFIFTRIIPLGLVLLTLATGAMFYFSLGGKVIPIMRIKRMWKYAIIGILLTFFAWSLVNLILKLAGFNIGIFGNWYL